MIFPFSNFPPQKTFPPSPLLQMRSYSSPTSPTTVMKMILVDGGMPATTKTKVLTQVELRPAKNSEIETFLFVRFVSAKTPLSRLLDVL